jgi:hypothetical protein
MVFLGIAIAAVAAFILSSVYYIVAPKAPPASAERGTARDERPKPWQILLELVRSAIVAGLLAGLMIAAGWSGAWVGALLGLSLFALPLVLLAGSVQWEKVPVSTAVLHAGDWLLKLVLIGVIVGLFV